MWEIVTSGKTTPPENAEAFWKWKVKAGNTICLHSRLVSRKRCWSTSGECVDTPKAAWDTFATLFSKKNDVTLQLLENELMSVVQQDLMNTCYTKI